MWLKSDKSMYAKHLTVFPELIRQTKIDKETLLSIRGNKLDVNPIIIIYLVISIRMLDICSRITLSSKHCGLK